MKSKFILLFLLAFSICVNAYSQIDPNVPVSKETYQMKLILPKVLPTEPYGIDAIISVGAFDNYQVSTNNGFAETDIAVNPRDPLNFVASDNRVTGFSGTPWVYYTTNGGVTWSNTAISSNQGDPVFCADSLGNFYLAVLSSGIRLLKSTNKGVSWTNLGNIVSNANADKEWIAADQTGGPYQNHVYMAYVNFSTGASVDFHRSTNNGASWSFVGNMGTGTPNPGPDVAVGPGGRVYLAWYNGGTVVRVSTDGGATFNAQVQASFHSTPGTVNGSGRYVLKTDIRVNGMPHIAVDMSSTSRRGYIYNVYASNPPGPDAADIFCTRSTDGGVTWSSGDPVRVNDDATFTDQWMCDVSVDLQGRVWAMWWDSRNDDPGNLMTETYGAVSTDGGLTFTNFKISNQNFNPAAVKIFQAANHYYLGDYQGIAGRTMTFPFYTGQNNTLQDFTAYLPDYGISFNKTIDSINPTSTSVVRMRNPVMGPYSGQVTYTTNISPSPAPGTLTPTFSPGNVRTFTGVSDSVLINTTSTANVPQGLYTVTVTGTETGGPRVHIRTYQIRVGNFVGIQQTNTEVPQVYSLQQNYPNPFNPVTNIKFGLPKGSFVTLKIYDMLGREVASLINNMNLAAGNYTYDFNAVNVPSGIYFYKLSAGEFSDVKKMTLVK
ncbi:MAG TPA: T9SS type A sorting domain-containing protein [Ignavibacteria bacterium]|nr:T9SS type A sorting domain-containing protein [Ignavibacteria bacterium]HMQ97938.1 T9SS type A sorting domain-containing protein [Ignavibacteria bacterium]